MHIALVSHSMPNGNAALLTLIMSATLLASGCASTTPRDMVIRIQAPKQLDSAAVQISDTRPTRNKESRADPDAGQVVYLGDLAFDPPPVSLINRFLSAKLGASQRPLVIEVLRFDVGISNSEVRNIYSTSPPIFTISGVPAGPTVIGNLVGQLLVAAFQGGASNQSVLVKIQVRGDAGDIEIADFGVLYSGRSISDAIQTVLPRALESLSTRIVEAKPESAGLGAEK